MNNFTVSVVVPAYNEQDNLAALTDLLVPILSQYHDYEIIFVDDGSSDNTLQVIKQLHTTNPHINYLSFSRNFGHQYALKAGLDHARGDCVISMDADLQHPPHLIPRLIEQWQHGNDVVYTIREDNANQSWLKRKTSALFYKLLNSITGLNTPRGAADFRLLDRKVVESVKNSPEKVLFLRGYISWLGFRQAGLTYQPAPRFAGTSHYTFRKMLALAVTGITSFGIQPLRLATWLGLLVSGLGVLFAIYTLYTKFIVGDVITGWTSLMIVILILGGTQLFIMGIFGEYLGTIFTESKRRPNYILRENSLSSDTSPASQTASKSNSRSAVSKPQTPKKPTHCKITKLDAVRGSSNLIFWLPTLFAALITGAILWGLLTDTAWLFGDDYLFMQAINKGRHMPLVFEAGRFYPLGFAEFNLLFLFPGARSIFAHDLVVAVMLTLVAITTVKLYTATAQAAHQQKSFTFQALLFFIMLIMTPAFIQIFLNIVYPEKMVILFLSLFMLFAVKAFTSGQTSAYLISLTAAVIATYSKEPVFGALLIIASTLLIFNYRALSRNDRYFAYALIFNGLVFLTFYYFAAYKDQVTFYNEGKNLAPRSQMLLAMLGRNKLLWVMIAAAAWRGVSSLLKPQDRVSLLFDGFLYAAIGWLLAYVALKLQDNYYLTPCYILGLPPLYYYLCQTSVSKWIKIAIWASLLILTALSKPTPWFLIPHTHQVRQQHQALLNYMTEYTTPGRRLVWFSPFPQIPQKLWMQQRIANIMTRFAHKRQDIYFATTNTIPPREPLGTLLIVSDLLHPQPAVQEPLKSAIDSGQLKLRDYLWNLRLYEVTR